MINKIRFILSIWTAKLVWTACRISGSRGSTLPGRWAHKICPGFLSIAAKKVRRKIIVVCGTNGKTTTTNLINDAAASAGYQTVCNNTGANMLNGIATAFLRRLSIFGGLDCDFASLEVDEATMPILMDQFIPDIIVVTNLFRDQLDRYGEADSAAKLLDEAFDKASGATLILNADDPVTSVFGIGRKARYYGITQYPDMQFCGGHRAAQCGICGASLVYEYFLYEHLGKYTCSGCGAENPQAEFGACNIQTTEGILNFDIIYHGGGAHIRTGVAGIYNVYNMLMSMAACVAAGIEEDAVIRTLCGQQPQPGRMSRFEINGKLIYLILAKNATSFNQAFTTVVNDGREKDVLLFLNDTPADGEDISWLWDVDFERLYAAGSESYTLSGSRRYDLYLRMKYADYDPSKISVSANIQEALGILLRGSGKTCYAIVNYSGIHPAYLELQRMEREQSEVAANV